MRAAAIVLVTLCCALGGAASSATAAIVPQPGFGPSLFNDDAQTLPVTKWFGFAKAGCPLTWMVDNSTAEFFWTDSKDMAYTPNGCFSGIYTQQPVTLTSGFCRLFFATTIDLIGADHFIVQSQAAAATSWQDEKYYLVGDNTAAWRREAVLIAKSTGSVSITFLIHGFGTTSANGVTIDDIDLRCDTVPPANPTPASTTHTPGAANLATTIGLRWDGASDHSTLASGVAGYSYVLDSAPTTSPDTTVDAPPATVTGSWAVAPGTYYFHLRTVDAAGNWSADSHVGPLIVRALPTVSAGQVSLGWRGGRDHWKLDRYLGTMSLRLAASETTPVSVRVAGPGIRGGGHAFDCAKVGGSACGAGGTFMVDDDTRLRLRLPAGVRPGQFAVTVTPVENPVAVKRTFRVRVPEEGILADFFFSRAPRGTPAERLGSRPTSVWLNHRWVSKPIDRSVHIVVVTPVGRVVFGAAVRKQRLGHTYVQEIPDRAGLHGRYRASLVVGGKLAPGGKAVRGGRVMDTAVVVFT